ncbi:MAG: ABC transporter substrate-binding protein [Acetobacteraceae bacterium]|nr:ABC transporter substrate-binding protein [Acetobacteraceae bacterium]MDW8398097.1 ABC transporter substrate-binding protein [Acetobacteraceae bacterium]
MRRRDTFKLLGAGLAAASPLAAPAVHAQALVDVRFSLDWALQGPQAPYIWAMERGYFREEGLNIVALDRGFGSGDVPVKILGGSYDVGIADINPTIRIKLERPEADIFSPFVVHDGTALAIMTLLRENIRRPADLVGKTIAAPETDAGRQMWPAFARATGLDPNSVTWLTVTPQLRETMLMQRRANAIAGFITSGILSLEALGARREEIVALRYGEHGVDLYSTSLLTSRAWANRHPQVVTGLIRAIVRAHNDARRDTPAVIAALRRREPLTNEAIEIQRLQLSLSELTFTPHVLANGFGRVDMARMQRAIDLTRAAFGIAREMQASEVYDPRFLPPAEALRAGPAAA